MVEHQDRTITIELSDSSAKDDDLRLDDFLEQMRNFKAALRETERVVFGSEPALYFRIKRLEKNSPPVVTLEAVADVVDERSGPEYASIVVRSLTTNLRVIEKRRRLPGKIDFQALASYRDLAAPPEKPYLRIRVQSGKHGIVIGSSFRETIDKIAGKDEFSYGSISGNIEAINLHDKNRRFTVFPVIGPSKISGTFQQKDRALFANAVDKYVTVYGRLRYKKWDH